MVTAASHTNSVVSSRVLGKFRRHYHKLRLLPVTEGKNDASLDKYRRFLNKLNSQHE